MDSPGPGRHRSPTRRRRRRGLGTALAIAVLAVIGFAVVVHLPASSKPSAERPSAERPSGDRSSGDRSAAPRSPASASVLAADPHPSSATRPASSTAHPTRSRPPARPAVRTPEGMWWGVDSVEPISAASLANVAGWYAGAPRPQFWGRYLSGDYAVSRAELAYARAQSIYVYLIVNDRNCSQCGGGDVCGNDLTGTQARTDAQDAVDAARGLRLPRATTLFKDIEQVSSCRGEPTADYLLGWYAAVRATGFRVGFYGNVHEQTYDFPLAYCRALALDRRIGTDVVLDMNEDEPLIGAPAGSTGPGTAPAFRPQSPSCAPPSATTIWQYGESTSPQNVTDIDQARPDTPGLLAPDGSVTA